MMVVEPGNLTKCNSGIAGESGKVSIFLLFLWIPEGGDLDRPSGKVFVFPMVLSGSQKDYFLKSEPFGKSESIVYQVQPYLRYTHVVYKRFTLHKLFACILR